MNTETGVIYTDVCDIKEAMLRGEPLEGLGKTEADYLEGLPRSERREELRRMRAAKPDTPKNSHAQRNPLHAGKRKRRS